MAFHNYPFDSHICLFQVGSYFYSKDIVSCTSVYNDPMSLLRQRNLQHRISFADLHQNETVIHLESGKYAACGFRVLIDRKRHQMIYQIYLPCFLFVCVSWVSFVVRPEVVPGRMALLVTLILVLVNIFNTVRSTSPIPSGSTLNAIDFYLVTSIVMVFLALLEYAVVLLAMHVSTFFNAHLFAQVLTLQMYHILFKCSDSNEVRAKKSHLHKALKMLQEEGSAVERGHLSAVFGSNRIMANENDILGKNVLDLVEDINAAILAAHPRRALLKENSYKVQAVMRPLKTKINSRFFADPWGINPKS